MKHGYTTLNFYFIIYDQLNQGYSMSIFKVEVVPITLEPHPNAETLSVVKVFDYAVCVRTADWKDKLLGAYIPPDSVVPNIAYDIIKREIPREDFWLRKIWNVNLPDAKDGYAVLIFEDGKFFLETYCTM